jgi:hypothetical protein
MPADARKVALPLTDLEGANAPSMINNNYKEEKGVILIQTI